MLGRLFQVKPTQLKGLALLFVCLSPAVLFVTWGGNGKGEIILINNASEEISLAMLEVGEEVVELGDMNIGEKLKYGYKIRKDSSVNLTIRFSSGKTVRKEIAYITSGFDFFDEVQILDSEIETIKSDVLLR